MVSLPAIAAGQDPGGVLRGVVSDRDFDVPLGGVQVQVLGTQLSTTTAAQGNYALSEVPAGTYTVVFFKEGYVRQVEADVLVRSGDLTDLNVSMPGDFTEMEEFVVQDVLQLGGGSEAALLQLRFESPALMDSISSDLMSRAGASDAASALKLVAGASVQNGKFAVIRGLPDRYVASLLNGVRLPSADEETRAVELDQFPAAVIESIQVTKTFTPDQQGDASGGAVDVRLKGIPDETVAQFNAQFSSNDNVTGRDDFLTYNGGGVNTFGLAGSEKDPQLGKLGENWDGAVGVTTDDAPINYRFSGALGGRHEVNSDLTIGGFASFFYKRDSSFYDDGVNDAYWIDNPGEGLSPQVVQEDGDEFFTALFDVTRAAESVQWGGLGTVGIETENHAIGLTTLYTHSAEDVAILSLDTRGKAFFFPDHDPNDPFSEGSIGDEKNQAPYRRSETLQYTERTTGSLQLRGQHLVSASGFELGGIEFEEPEIDWTLSTSFARLYQPDKRLFSSQWTPEAWDGEEFDPPAWGPVKPAASFLLGNLQRIWKEIDEDGVQLSASVKFPFEQWDGERGFLKFGVFDDSVEREFDLDSYSNFEDQGSDFTGDFDDPWSNIFPFEDHPITESEFDVDYDGKLDVRAVYGMFDLPLSESVNMIAGARVESTDLSIVLDPEELAQSFTAGQSSPGELEPGEADVDFAQTDFLPALGFVFDVADGLTLRTSYSRTLARQTFRELTPVVQQEFLGGPIFIGNPDLKTSSLDNYDVRVDFRPYEGGLFSFSWFRKNIEDAIEFVQREVAFTFTSPENYPEGTLAGYEVELRQDLGRFWDAAEGLSFGGNATFIDSEVTLPQDESDVLATLGANIKSRDATLAPEHIYNLFLTYDIEDTGTRAAIFYTVEGDTLVAGAGESLNNFVPSVYAKEFGTLNASLMQPIGDHWSIKLQAKNLTNPKIKEVYRSDLIGSDVTKTSFTRGREFSIGVTYRP
ncbi:MAG: TonB-dependent receptor [Planctomycetota bacterium]